MYLAHRTPPAIPFHRFIPYGSSSFSLRYQLFLPTQTQDTVNSLIHFHYTDTHQPHTTGCLECSVIVALHYHTNTSVIHNLPNGSYYYFYSSELLLLLLSLTNYNHYFNSYSNYHTYDTSAITLTITNNTTTNATTTTTKTT